MMTISYSLFRDKIDIVTNIKIKSNVIYKDKQTVTSFKPHLAWFISNVSTCPQLVIIDTSRCNYDDTVLYDQAINTNPNC